MSKSKRSALHVWAHTGQRMTYQGRIDCAMNGCLECHQAVMELYQIMLETLHLQHDGDGAITEDEFMRHQEYAAHRAIHPLNAKASRPPRSDKEVIEYLKIGRYIEVLHRKGMPVKKAIEAGMAKFFVGDSKAIQARNEFLATVKQMNQAAEDIKKEESQDN